VQFYYDLLEGSEIIDYWYVLILSIILVSIFIGGMWIVSKAMSRQKDTYHKIGKKKKKKKK
jgi:hypothetical protein